MKLPVIIYKSLFLWIFWLLCFSHHFWFVIVGFCQIQKEAGKAREILQKPTVKRGYQAPSPSTIIAVDWSLVQPNLGLWWVYSAWQKCLVCFGGDCTNSSRSFTLMAFSILSQRWKNSNKLFYTKYILYLSISITTWTSTLPMGFQAWLFESVHFTIPWFADSPSSPP